MIGTLLTTQVEISLRAANEGKFDEVADNVAASLTPAERGLLPIIAARAAESRHLERLVADVIEDVRRSAPVSTFDDVWAEAKLWASWANQSELKEYMSAIWCALPKRLTTSLLTAVHTTGHT